MRSRYSISKPTFLTWSACLVIALFSDKTGLAKETPAERTPEEAAAQITLPEIEFEDVSLAEAIECLRIESKDCDAAKRGVNFLLSDQRAAEQKRFSLKLANVVLNDALHKIAAITGWTVRFDPRVVVLTLASHPQPNKPLAQSPLAKRASSIIRPQVNFQGASVEEAVEILRISPECHEFADPARKPVNIVTHLPTRLATAEIISLDLRDVSMLDVLGYIAELAGLRLRVDENAFVFEEAVPAAEGKTKRFQPTSASNPLSKIEERASKIIIPNIEFVEASVPECVEFLRLKTARLHNPEGDSRAVNVRLATPEEAALPTITLFLRDIPLRDVLRYVAELAELKLRVDGDAYVFEVK
jgi:hypothetical protein